MSDTCWKTERDKDVLARLAAKLGDRRVKPLTPNQGKYLDAIDRSKATVCTGPAGTGKTYMACGKAMEMLQNGDVARIVLTRPLKECGGEMGFMPGDVNAKTVDMMVPLIEALEEFSSPAEVKKFQEEGRIVTVPLEKMRGRTLKNGFVILDEAQNASYLQLKMFVTRFGSKCKMVVCGDYTQSDLPYTGRNSLWELVERFKLMPEWHPAVSLVVLNKDDIVRDELVKWFVDATDGSFEEKVKQARCRANPAYDVVPCPDCGKDVWYDRETQKDYDALVVCPYCETHVELYDEAGRLDPYAVDAPSHEDDEMVVVVQGQKDKP